MDGDLTIVPRGIVQKVLPTQYAYVSNQYMAMEDSIWKFYNLRGVFDRRDKEAGSLVSDLYLRDYSVCLNSAGTFFEQNLLYAKSLEYFELAHKFFPSDHEYIYNMGNAYYNLGNLSGAVEMYEDCLKINPGYESAWFNLGVCYYKQHNYAEALEKFKKVLELNPGRSDIKPYIDMMQRLISK
jgi:tetratricopeptide (TPR) repeat protein